MKKSYNMDTRYPLVEDLRRKAQKRIPQFAFNYLDGGCNEEINLKRNTEDIRKITFVPDYLSSNTSFNKEIFLLGDRYSAPFGIAPIGLQGLIWPDAPRILARASKEHNIPFILSTVSTCSIEDIAKETEGRFWFQLYYPAQESIRNSIIERAWNSGCKVLVLLCDTPTFGYRAKEIKNGLSMPPSMSLKNIVQMCMKPAWALNTLLVGKPYFATLKPYMQSGLSIKQLGQFMDHTFSGRLTEDRISAIRDKWKGKLVLKGVVSEMDAERAVNLGIDGVIVSNHGGRQIDAGESSIDSLKRVVRYKDKMTVMIDSGVRSGPDIARVIGKGASCTFLGRTFMYSVAAIGNKGGDHIVLALKKQLQQIMEQIGCPEINRIRDFIKDCNMSCKKHN